MEETRKNPVSDVVRIRDGQKSVVSSAKITVEGWRGTFIRWNGKILRQEMEDITGKQVYVFPPNMVLSKMRAISEALFNKRALSS